jgi:hypothetical protein
MVVFIWLTISFSPLECQDFGDDYYAHGCIRLLILPADEAALSTEKDASGGDNSHPS